MARIFLTGGSGFIGGEIALAAIVHGHSVVNFDIAPPHFPGHEAFWIKGDVRDLDGFHAAVADSQPDILIHLASDTDVQNTRIDQFTTTMDGTRNAVEVANRVKCLKKFVHISTQFVVRPGIVPRDELHLEPYTVYGEAKAETELIVRGRNLAMPWIMIRPTIIWGPNHPSFKQNIFKYIQNGSYLHPVGSKKIMRTFGYVTNVANQILNLSLTSPKNIGNRHVFYVGDETIDYDEWADGFSIGLTGKRARRIPVWVLSILGKVGDAAKSLGLPCPIDSGRVFRMSTSSAIDLAPTLHITGVPAVPFDVGVARTLAWIND